MAKGADSEAFVLMSESETGSGLKRELAIVLNNQSELSTSIDRRNLGNRPSSNVILEYSRKRFKKAGGSGELKKDVENSLRKNESLKESVRISFQWGNEPQSNKAASSMSEEPGNLVEAESTALNAPLEKELENNLVSPVSSKNVVTNLLNVPCVVESQNDLTAPSSSEEPKRNMEKVASEEVQQKRLPPSSEEPKSNMEKVASEEVQQKRLPPSSEEPKNNVEKVVSEEVQQKRFTRSALKFNELPSVLDGGNETEDVQNFDEKAPRELVFCLRSPLAVVEETSGLQPQKRLRRSNKKLKAESPAINDNSKVHSILMEKTLKQPTMSDSEPEVPTVLSGCEEAHEGILRSCEFPRQFSCTAVDSKIEHMMIVGNKETQDASPVKPSRRYSRIALECMTEPRLMDENNKLLHTLLETPVRRFTRSALACKKQPKMMDEDSRTQTTLAEKSPRRFTRSTLKLDDPVGMPATATSCDSHAASVAISPIRTPLHKKLEMKMSKKIALTKFPTKINELLDTGMLEGLSVVYKMRAQKDGVLRGTIKGSGILCLCSLCKGCKVVTPNEFERHAGSSNRNPQYYLYLDNGNSLRNVLNACKDAPLDLLEATIQIAIQPSSFKNDSCLNCRRPFLSKTRRTLVLCNSCLEFKKFQTSPCKALTVSTRSNQPASSKGSEDSPKCISSQNKSNRGKLTRKDLRLHKLVFEEDGLPDGTELAYYVRGQKLLEGYKKGFGIFCFCCNSEISPSQFEAHAGWAQRRKPYLHIYTSNGVSLHELSISLSKGRKFSAKDNDDLCGICADFGDLLLCDGCPRAFHKDCVGLLSVPRGKWYCPYCQNLFVKDQACAHNVNALAAGRVSGVDPIEQISKRCIRIVKTPETEVGGCTLCRVPGFSKSYFGPRTIILCDQCEREFHVGCLKDHNMGDLKELPKGNWFCSRDCSRISTALHKCVLRGSEELPDSITKMIKLKQKEPNSKVEISWRLLSGKVASPESRSLLSKAVAIFHNRFDPIVDVVTGRDLIPCMVYGRNIRDQEFGKMFCAVLTVNSSVVSAGLLRVFGQELAELPLVATSSDYQGQGCFQSLFSCIERLLGFLDVKTLVLPAAEEAEAIWTEKFGFQKVSHDQMTKYTKEYQMTVFRGTPILHKPVPKCRIIRGAITKKS